MRRPGNKLTPIEKVEIVRLRRTEGLTYAILAERMGCSLSTVSITVRTAAKKEKGENNGKETS